MQSFMSNFRRRWEFDALNSVHTPVYHRPTLAFGVHDTRSMLNSVSGSLEKYLDLLSVRQKAIASNIANADTPGYKTRDVDFQAEFRKLLAGGEASVTEVSGLKTKNDGNNVSIDREAQLLSENTLRFSAASNLLRSNIRVLRSAIREGKNG